MFVHLSSAAQVGMLAGLLGVFGGACGDDSNGTTTTTTTAETTGETEVATETETETETEVAPETETEVVQETATETEVVQETIACGTPAACAVAAEERTADYLVSIARDDASLWGFVREIPKGGDLHQHLSGAVYAETFLDWAEQEGGYCITTATMSLASSCSGAGKADIPQDDDPLYQEIVAAWSMENFDPDGPESGHDHFFATFGKFGAMSGTHHGEMLADVRTRAAGENEHYIELMLTSNSTAATLGDDNWSGTLTAQDLPGFYATLKASPKLDAAIKKITDDVTASENESETILKCGTADAQPGCAVVTRYEVYISRSGSAPGVFAQMVAAYEAAIRDPRVVAVNLVGPEDNSTSLSRYDIEMAMLGFMYDTYRATEKSPLRLSLHAGELTAEYIPASTHLDVVNHIRKAVDVAHAERIGHGVDVMHEADPNALLDDLHAKDVAVEICLSSNLLILEVSGADHPLQDYLQHGVPVSLATDDQGVSRSSIAVEFRRAVEDQGLDYRQLKQLARTSLTYSFAPGASIWQSLADRTLVAACAPVADDPNGYLGMDPPPEACAALIAGSLKAQLEWELERRFHTFEAAH